MSLSRRALLTLSTASLLAGVASQAFGQGHPRIGLIFVGASWCPVCHAAAAVLAPAAERSGMEILVASQDGKAIKPWADFVDARGNPLTQGITAIPTLLFVDLAQGQVIGKLEGFRSPGQYLGSIRSTLVAAGNAGHG